MSEDNKPLSPVEVSTDSTVTPITRQKIERVDISGWKNLSISQLTTQLETLQLRYYALLNMGRGDLAEQVEGGITRLTNYITIRTEEDDDPKKLTRR